MRLRKSLVAVTIAIGCCAFSFEIVACSSSNSTVPPEAGFAPLPEGGCVDGGLTISFNPMYSAYDGMHMYTIPAVVNGSAGQVTWSADSTMVEMQVDLERSNEVLIQMLKAGDLVINVKSTDGKCGSAPLFVSQAAVSDWQIGSARYNDGMSLHLAAGASPGNKSPLEQGGGSGPACTSCHGETATNGPFTDVSHTPEQTGGFSDQDLLNIILRGDFPDGGFFDTSIVTYAGWHNFHRWADITTDQQKGIITYLRSLPPRNQRGSVNFNAFDMDSGSGDDQGEAVPPDTGTPDATSIDASMDAGVLDASDGATE